MAKTKTGNSGIDIRFRHNWIEIRQAWLRNRNPDKKYWYAIELFDDSGELAWFTSGPETLLFIAKKATEYFTLTLVYPDDGTIAPPHTLDDEEQADYYER